MTDYVRSRLRQTTHTTRGAVLTGARWLARQEASVLVAALVILLALFGFIRIAEELGEGELAHLDEWILHLLRVPGDPQTPIGPPWLLEAARDITPLGGRTLLVAVTLFVIGYLALERIYGAMWLVGVATAGGGLLTTGMKELFGRARPDLVPHLVAVTSELPERALSPGRRPVLHPRSLARPLRGATAHQGVLAHGGPGRDVRDRQ